MSGGWGKKGKIEDWNPPSGIGMVVSALPEDLQLTSMRRQVDALSQEIEEHASYKKPMERQYAFNLSVKSKALANWHRKQKYLTLEYDRYSTYVQVLRTSATDKQRRLMEDTPDGGGALSDGEGYSSRNTRGGRTRRRKVRQSFSTVDSVSSAEEAGSVLSGVRE
ncbi:hypothetical protein HDU67_002304 [Dinochytrium kinnereticum]|nr:hypothetical protein HDU67_002304 [Dinochytrium kinnereticum]